MCDGQRCMCLVVAVHKLRDAYDSVAHRNQSAE